MNTRSTICYLLMFVIIISISDSVRAQAEISVGSKDTLAVLWTSADPDVAEKVCLMYTHAALKHKWFKQVILIVWGPSAKLLSENKSLQDKIKAMISDGVYVQACVVCADSYEVSGDLRGMGIEVIGMGKPLTTYLKRDYSILTF